jgi:2-hydroxy-3-oxopropionate reductase
MPLFLAEKLVLLNGNLSIMLGGDKKIIKKVMPLLKVIGDKITHIGKSGAGQVAKACNQIIVAQTINAVSEAFMISDSI